MGQRAGRRKVELRPFDTWSLTVRTESGCCSVEDFEAFIYHHAGVCRGFHQISKKYPGWVKTKGQGIHIYFSVFFLFKPFSFIFYLNICLKCFLFLTIQTFPQQCRVDLYIRQKRIMINDTDCFFSPCIKFLNYHSIIFSNILFIT